MRRLLFCYGTARVMYFRLAADTLLSVGSLLIQAELQSVHEKKHNLRKKRDFRKKKRNLQKKCNLQKKKCNLHKKKRDLRMHILSALRQNGRPAGGCADTCVRGECGYEPVCYRCGY